MPPVPHPTRRDFLAGAAAGTAALTLPNPAPAAPARDEKLPTGVVVLEPVIGSLLRSSIIELRS